MRRNGQIIKGHGKKFGFYPGNIDSEGFFFFLIN